MASIFNHLPPFLTRLVRPLAQPARGLSVAAPGDASSSHAPGEIPAGAQRCTVAAGCFWGTEALYRRHFAGKGLVDCKVGYIGGNLDDPTYRAVCGGKTGHAEAAQIIFDPSVVSYATLLEFFFRMHDPTTLNAQGPDTGPQYRSAVYYHDAEQEAVARRVLAAADDQWWKGRVVTELAPAGKWWTAEEYHQEYLDRNPGGYECPSHFLRSFPPLKY
ncbi:Peptide-methionine (S)-S-oxide reductase [Purpureocillium takamizusanense]|uniref:peptide-methionine (S)-S-oxide reductase n=1 Tax=Purpureocillium takamizusanense TaxID=2060973 RepID=A0A9Q8VFB6_9HYPO|nr:Peptide-methionine (S)-S-oxide reductase [Purpureocillium takamizusanense]UNI23256.1 Peptide-methionine (S)-S-oxide reductase [Purpureocillium takamizusanense]